MTAVSDPAVPEALVQLEGVGRTYPGPVPVAALRDCHLAVGRGEHVSIVGPSGSGKSTLLNVIGLLDVPDAGRYLFDGHDVGALEPRDLAGLRAHAIGFVFQAFHLVGYRTAVENVALGMLYTGLPARDRRRRAVSALEQVGLGHRLHSLPRQLSGGERQRVAIARAVAHDPRLLLCDEPTGNLDTRTSDEVLTSLEELRRGGVTLVVITHDPGVAARASRTVVIHDGVLSEPAPDAA